MLDIAGLRILSPVTGESEPRTLGRFLRTLRGKATQTEFGAALGYTQTQVSDWERGARHPDRDNIAKLVDGLNRSGHHVTVDDFMRLLPRRDQSGHTPGGTKAPAHSPKAGASHVGSPNEARLHKRIADLERELKAAQAFIDELGRSLDKARGEDRAAPRGAAKNHRRHRGAR